MSGESDAKKSKMEGLSPRSRKLVDAMSLTMGVRFTGIDKKLDEVSTGIAGLSDRVGEVETSVMDQGSRLKSVEEELAKLKRDGLPPTPSAGGTAASSSDNGGLVPKSHRRTILFAFWPKDTPREEIVSDLKTFDIEPGSVDPIEGFFAPSRFCNKGKVKFINPGAMWRWVKEHKGAKFKDAGAGPIWWTVDKPEEERNAAKKVSIAIRKLKEYVTAREGETSEADLALRVPADYDNNFVLLKATPEGRAVRILEKPKGETLWRRAEGAPDLENFDWMAALSEINSGP